MRNAETLIALIVRANMTQAEVAVAMIRAEQAVGARQSVRAAWTLFKAYVRLELVIIEMRRRLKDAGPPPARVVKR